MVLDLERTHYCRRANATAAVAAGGGRGASLTVADAVTESLGTLVLPLYQSRGRSEDGRIVGREWDSASRYSEPRHLAWTGWRLLLLLCDRNTEKTLVYGYMVSSTGGIVGRARV